MLYTMYNKHRLLHCIFHIIPFISRRSWYQPESKIGSRDDIWMRADKGYDIKNDMLCMICIIIYSNRGNNWFVPKCFSWYSAWSIRQYKIRKHLFALSVMPCYHICRKTMWVNVNLQLIDNKKKGYNNGKNHNNIKQYIYNTSLNVHVNNYSWLIDWCLMPTLAIFQLYFCVN